VSVEFPWHAYFNQVWNFNGGVNSKEGDCLVGISYQIHVCEQEFFRGSHWIPFELIVAG
jgi:hypothetical protein